MSDAYINQLTLDCLLNKERMGLHVMKQREKQRNKEDLQFYSKRIHHLFKDLLHEAFPPDLPPDVTYAYDNFVKATIHYFKIADSNDILQQEYADLDLPPENPENDDTTTAKPTQHVAAATSSQEIDKILMRTVKMDLPTLDKYVKRTQKKAPRSEEQIVLPKFRETNLSHPALKNKGIKKNICSIYEDNDHATKDEDMEEEEEGFLESIEDEA